MVAKQQRPMTKTAYETAAAEAKLPALQWLSKNGAHKGELAISNAIESDCDGYECVKWLIADGAPKVESACVSACLYDDDGDRYVRLVVENDFPIDANLQEKMLETCISSYNQNALEYLIGKGFEMTQ